MVLVRQRANGSKTGTVLAQEEYQYDGFGRVVRERRDMPDFDWVARNTVYDAMGNRSMVSEWYDAEVDGDEASASHWTSYLDYDAFGRPGTIEPPDGPSHNVTMSYTGDRLVARTVKVASATGEVDSATDEVDSTTTEHYDRQGRLYEVTEPSGTGGADVTTTYTYDVGNRLSAVSTVSSSATQVRTFNYDGRGFLTSETHPEKSEAVTYSQYDALGHAGRKEDGPNDLKFVYDGTERLTEVRESASDDLLKEFAYATANDTTDLKQGKLETATRYNSYKAPAPGLIFSSGFECGDTSGWGGIELSCSFDTEATIAINVKETYTYEGKGGRVSQRDTEIFVDGVSDTAFTQDFTYTNLGNVATLGYPRCTSTGCPSGTSRDVSYTYTRGLLTAVGGYASPIDYHPNGLLYRIYHPGAPRLVQDLDANGMVRPAKISAKHTVGSSTTTLWTTGTYTYDGAGNVKSIGGSSFDYDKVSRLVSAAIARDKLGTGTDVVSRKYTYDAFGNLTSITPGRTIPTNSATNRLAGSVTYDNAGNLTSWNGNVYEFDPLNMMTEFKSGSEHWVYIYTADDERILMKDIAHDEDRYTLRDLGGKVLRAYSVDSADTWTLERDYVYANGQLVAAETPEGLRHFYADHLGTPRLVTDASGNQVAYHVYYPFGEEATNASQNEERMKFTGHERDLANPSGTGDDLDYMHARYCSPLTGRFLSIDPVGGRPEAPQSWNGYSYVWNNPLVLVDPSGETVYLVLYTQGNSRGDNEFRRAAETRAAEIRDRADFNSEEDIVILRNVSTKADFVSAIDEANSLDDPGFGDIGSLALYSHGGPADGPIFPGEKPRDKQFKTSSEIRDMTINWESGGGCALFYACNSADNFAQLFATAQGVPAYGYDGWTYFSSNRHRREGPAISGPLYLIYAAGFANDGVLGWVAKETGMAPDRGMTRRDP